MSAPTMTADLARSRRRRLLAAAALLPLTVLAGSLAPQAAAAQQREAASIAAGNAHSCAIENSRAYCWGENDYGQLGDGRTADSGVPVAVDASGALAGQQITQISAGGGGGLDTCALTSTGAAFCWGSNYDGGLGAGRTGSSSSVPVAVDTGGALAGRKLVQISTGSNGACVLDSAGAAYCWGDNAYWELGDGRGGSDGDYSAVPVPVQATGALAGKTLTQITAGWLYGRALDTAGAAYCWGTGALGRTGTSSVPVAVDTSGALAGRPLIEVSAGLGETCALARTGAADCWGDNSDGELGNGSTASSAVPVAVDTHGALAGKILAQVTAGAFHACAADSAHAVYCWGDNDQGDLGDNRTAASDVPVLVGPQAPAQVTAVSGDNKAKVSWRAPASLDGGTVTGYAATATPGGAGCTSTATSCTITGLRNGITYAVTVVARTTAGESGASSPALVTPEAAGAPAGPIRSAVRPAKCLVASNGSGANDAKIALRGCDGSAVQRWTIEASGALVTNGKCMDIYRDEKRSNAPVELWTCTGGANQKWQARHGALVNPVSGKCLDDPRYDTADGTQLEIYTCDGGANQRWILPGAAAGPARPRAGRRG